MTNEERIKDLEKELNQLKAVVKLKEEIARLQERVKQLEAQPVYPYYRPWWYVQPYYPYTFSSDILPTNGSTITFSTSNGILNTSDSGNITTNGYISSSLTSCG